AILIFQVIRVFPYVDTEDRRSAVHKRTVLIWRGNYFKGAILVLDQPRPATAETADTSSTKFFFKLIEATERGFDVIGEFAFGLAAGIRSHDLPKEWGIGVSAAVVSPNCANVFRKSIQIADETFYSLFFKVGALHCLVQVITQTLGCFLVVNSLLSRMDVRLQRIICVG